ncbi:MAG: restriction endonuclease subunit S [Bacteroidales bacterium]|nr:restriction endonuclease subunit S [Bacteroidales bacterium]
MNTSNWEYFAISKIFNSFERGKVHSQSSLPFGNDYFYVGAKKNRCGVMTKCGYDIDLISKGNCIIFICNGEGSVGYCNYMDRDFMASGDLILAYGNFLNQHISLFLVTMLDMERPKYSFGRKYGKYVKSTKIPLPVTTSGNPDWQWIEDYVKKNLVPKLPDKSKSVWEKNFDTKPLSNNKLQLNTKEWEWFRIGDYFDKPYKATAYNAIELITCSKENKDSIAYITRTDANNGCKDYVINEGFTDIESGNAITIGDTTATIYYQENDFICGDHMVVLRSSLLNKYVGLFITSLLNKERFRYNYGRAFNKGIVSDTRLKLPATKNAQGEYEPDWQWMEDYIKGLPYSSCL